MDMRSKEKNFPAFFSLNILLLNLCNLYFLVFSLFSLFLLCTCYIYLINKNQYIVYYMTYTNHTCAASSIKQIFFSQINYKVYLLKFLIFYIYELLHISTPLTVQFLAQEHTSTASLTSQLYVEIWDTSPDS